ncbi:MAG TPA: hypothetical protein PKH61_01605 [Microbacteriaceae bacterium]|nr:hypothetical protein [Microbacteriaceae bacterium]
MTALRDAVFGPQRIGALVLAGILALALALTGCSAEYDGVLWRQMDAAESTFYEPFRELRDRSASSDDVIAAIQSDTYWAGRATPDALTTAEAAAVTYHLRADGLDGSGDGELAFDTLVYSGIRDPATPRELRGGGTGGRYSGPTAVYTCFTIRVSFTDDRMTGWLRDWADPGLPCPDSLVAALDAGARYVAVAEFDG